MKVGFPSRSSKSRTSVAGYPFSCEINGAAEMPSTIKIAIQCFRTVLLGFPQRSCREVSPREKAPDQRRHRHHQVIDFSGHARGAQLGHERHPDPERRVEPDHEYQHHPPGNPRSRGRRHEQDYQDRRHGAEVPAKLSQEVMPAMGLRTAHQQERVVADVRDRRAQAVVAEQETGDYEDPAGPDMGQKVLPLASRSKTWAASWSNRAPEGRLARIMGCGQQGPSDAGQHLSRRSTRPRSEERVHSVRSFRLRTDTVHNIDIHRVSISVGSKAVPLAVWSDYAYAATHSSHERVSDGVR